MAMTYDAIVEKVQARVEAGKLTVEQAEEICKAAEAKYTVESSKEEVDDATVLESSEDAANEQLLQEAEEVEDEHDFMCECMLEMIEDKISRSSVELYESIYEGIQEKYEEGVYTLEDANELNDMAYNKYVTESFVSSPLKKKLDKLKEIKDAKPGEYDGPEEIKQFVDKNYADIEKACKLLQEEPEKLKKDEVGFFASTFIAILSMLGSVFVVHGSGALGIAMAFGGYGFLIVGSLLWGIIRYCRTHNDAEGMKQLTKVKTALKKVDAKKLPKEYQKKIADMLSNIDDAETDIYAKIKKVND